MSVELVDSNGPLESADRVYGRINDAPKSFSPDLLYDFIKSRTDTLYPTQGQLSSLDDYVTAFTLQKGENDNTIWEGQGLRATGFADGVERSDLATVGQIIALSTALIVGVSAVVDSTAGRVLYNNAGTLGEYEISGAGKVLMDTNPVVASALTLGTQQTTRGSLVLANAAAGAYPVTVQSSNSTSAAWSLTLPTTAGTNGQALTTNGSGATSWTTFVSVPAGSATQVQYNNGGAFDGAAGLTVDGSGLLSGINSIGVSQTSDAQLKLTRISGSTAADFIYVTGTISGDNLFCRAFTDTTSFSSAASINPGAYCSFAAYSTLTSSAASNHYYGFESAPTISGSGAVNVLSGYYSTATLAGPTDSFRHFWAGSPNVTTGSATNQYGFFCDNLTYAGGTNTYGFYSNVNAAGGGTRYGFFAQGDATNVFNGGVVCNALLYANANLDVTGTITLSSNAILTSPSSAKLQLGAADASSAVAQTLGVQNVVAGTSNTAGADFTIRGSAGTGTGAGGSIVFKTAAAGSSGTSQNTWTTVLTIDSSAIATLAGTLVTTGAIFIGPSYDLIVARQTTGILKVYSGGSNAGGVLFDPKLFSGLPGAPSAGMVCAITDCNTTTWGATAAGGGANYALVFYNGANWKVIGA